MRNKQAQARHLELSFLVGRFVTDHLIRVHHLFDGDLVAALVLATIANRNMQRYYEDVARKSAEGLDKLVEAREHLAHLRALQCTLGRQCYWDSPRDRAAKGPLAGTEGMAHRRGARRAVDSVRHRQSNSRSSMRRRLIAFSRRPAKACRCSTATKILLLPDKRSRSPGKQGCRCKKRRSPQAIFEKVQRPSVSQLSASGSILVTATLPKMGTSPPACTSVSRRVQLKSRAEESVRTGMPL